MVHAPRQTGKTTSLRALARELTDEGKYAALHFSCEAGGPVGDDYRTAQQLIVGDMMRSAAMALLPELRPPSCAEQANEADYLSQVLTAWAQQCPRPLVLLMDEVDALRDTSLESVLRQLRAGYVRRPKGWLTATKTGRSRLLTPFTQKSFRACSACKSRWHCTKNRLVRASRRPAGHDRAVGGFRRVLAEAWRNPTARHGLP